MHKNKDNSNSYNNLSRDEHELKEKISSIKNIYTNLNNINYRDLKKSSKIIVNKNSNPIIVKDEKISEKNSKSDLKEKERDKDKNTIPTKDKVKEREDKAHLIEKEKEKDKSKEKSNKIIPDKDLSDTENDSLLLYVNSNIENNLYQDSALNESSCSMLSTLKENGKFSCYNRDMEIISNYIKNYLTETWK